MIKIKTLLCLFAIFTLMIDSAPASSFFDDDPYYQPPEQENDTPPEGPVTPDDPPVDFGTSNMQGTVDTLSGPYQIYFDRHEGETCLVINQDNSIGFAECQGAQNKDFFFDYATGEVVVNQTTKLCLDASNTVWYFTECRNSKEQQFRLENKHLVHGAGMCLDIGNDNRNFPCAKFNVNQVLTFTGK